MEAKVKTEMTGQEYQKIRKVAGLTQEELAKKVGVSWNTIARREASKKISKESEIVIKLICKKEIGLL